MDERVIITQMGASGLLLDAAGARFSDTVQARVLATAGTLRGRPGVAEVVPGMNNLMIEFDAGVLRPDDTRALLLETWMAAVPDALSGKEIEIPVTYGGEKAEDLAEWAAGAGFSISEAVERHAAGLYTVAAVGAMPGFGYLSGLDPALARPRRAVPRMVTPEGAVIIGGAQTAVMPTTAPSGWHIIGMTDVGLFDPAADPPCLFSPGDRVRFTIRDLIA